MAASRNRAGSASRGRECPLAAMTGARLVLIVEKRAVGTFTLAVPRLDVDLPRCDRGHRGARLAEQVDGWLPAATLELKDDDLADIAAAIYATGAGTGPASPSSPSSLFAAPRRQQGARWAQPEAQPRVS